MAGSVNKVTLLGNLGADPEVRTTQNGTKVATLSVATSESWKDKNSGEKKERTEWHRVVIWGGGQDNAGLAGIAEQYLKKGSKVYLEGSLQTRKWQDQSGQEKYTTEVVLQGFGAQLVLIDRSEGGGNRPPPPESQDDYGRSTSRQSSSRPSKPANSGGPAFSDDIPF